MIEPDKLFTELELSGEKSVREKLAQGVYGQDKKLLIYEWLRQKEEERINSATSRADAAAYRAESITLKQLALTRKATWAAWIAAIVAILTFIFTLLK